MLENRLPNGELTDACSRAKARGAKLVTGDACKEILEEHGVLKDGRRHIDGWLGYNHAG